MEDFECKQEPTPAYGHHSQEGIGPAPLLGGVPRKRRGGLSPLSAAGVPLPPR